MPRTTIFTLDARDHVFLEVSRDHFQIGPDRMFREIQAMFLNLTDTLKKKGIEYNALKSALVPSTDRRELALVFDSSRIESSFYGYPIFGQLIPLFSKEGNFSVLAGDYIGDDQDALFEIFSESVTLVRPTTFSHSTQFFIVYINNLSDATFTQFVEGLEKYEAFVGYADVTLSSRFKMILSTMLPNCCIKHRGIILMGHEDDRNESEDINLPGYPFEESGFVVRSIASLYFGLFLSYKIERPVFSGYESDTEFSLNAVHPEPKELKGMTIRIDDNKLEYLKTSKGGSLKRLGLLEANGDQLKKIISDRISSNYIYNMTFDDTHNVSKFDIVLEVRGDQNDKPFKVMVALEYQPSENSLRLITLY